jgi:transcriptional regulator with XRE-family HTH domain
MYDASMPQREADFGSRVRAARGFADITQAELARRISEQFPGNSVSAATVKRLEHGDPSVKGTQVDWSRWVSATTDTPQWFLEYGWDAMSAVGHRSIRLLKSSVAQLREEIRDFEPQILKSAELPFEILDGQDAAAVADRLTSDGMQLRAIIAAVEHAQSGTPSEQSYARSVVLNALIALPITHLHARAILGVAMSYFGRRVEVRIHQAQMEDREFGFVGSAMRQIHAEDAAVANRRQEAFDF